MHKKKEQRKKKKRKKKLIKGMLLCGEMDTHLSINIAIIIINNTNDANT